MKLPYPLFDFDLDEIVAFSQSLTPQEQLDYLEYARKQRAHEPDRLRKRLDDAFDLELLEAERTGKRLTSKQIRLREQEIFSETYACRSGVRSFQARLDIEIESVLRRIDIELEFTRRLAAAGIAESVLRRIEIEIELARRPAARLASASVGAADVIPVEAGRSASSSTNGKDSFPAATAVYVWLIEELCNSDLWPDDHKWALAVECCNDKNGKPFTEKGLSSAFANLMRNRTRQQPRLPNSKRVEELKAFILARK